jgi:hypothetical protein
MKIYTNGTYKILSIDKEPKDFIYAYEVKENPFPTSWSIEKILTYHYLEIDDGVKIYP